MYEREPLKDTILSYAGLRDPVTQTVWGGVIGDKGSVAGNWGNEKSGAYFGIGYQRLTGHQVPTNQRVDGTVGMYWRLIATPVGSLTVGANLFAMHYDRNLRYFTLGQGGYFSPSRFVLFGLPVTWSGKWNHLEYTAAATIGSQSFTEESSSYFPLQTAIQGASGPFYPRYSSSGTNYNVDFRTAYQLSPNWYIGGFFNTNNANFYTLSALGITVRYSFKPRPIDAGFNVPSLPDFRGKQPFGLP
jgi:hypothetical protein